MYELLTRLRPGQSPAVAGTDKHGKIRRVSPGSPGLEIISANPAPSALEWGSGLHRHLTWTKSGEASGTIAAAPPAAGGATAIPHRSARIAASRSAIGLMARTRIALRR